MAEPKTRNEVISGMNADQATLHGDEPPVDTSHAAALKVSRLRGKALKIAIGVVAGTGVGVDLTALIAVYPLWLRPRCYVSPADDSHF